VSETRTKNRSTRILRIEVFNFLLHSNKFGIGLSLADLLRLLLNGGLENGEMSTKYHMDKIKLTRYMSMTSRDVVFVEKKAPVGRSLAAKGLHNYKLSKYVIK
jgi:hypothetical protein